MSHLSSSNGDGEGSREPYDPSARHEPDLDPEIYDPDDTGSTYNDPRYSTLPQFSPSDFDDLVPDPPPVVLEIIQRHAGPLVGSLSGQAGVAGQLPPTIEQVFSEPGTGSGKKRRRETGPGRSGQDQQEPKKLRQTAITNFMLGAEGQPQYVHPDRLYKPPATITVTGESNEFTAFYTEPPDNEDDGLEREDSSEQPEPKQVGELTLFEDDDGFWVNDIEVNQAYRRQGIATELVKAACREHGTIFFSLQTKAQCTAEGDTRWMTTDGAALARRLSASTITGVNVRVAMPGEVNAVPLMDEDEESQPIEPEGQVQQAGREERKERSREDEDIEQVTTTTTQTRHEEDDEGMDDEWRDEV